MAKCIDITDKLSFDKNPALIIKGRKIRGKCRCGYHA